MDFTRTPEAQRTLDASRAFVDDVADGLPRDPSGFFRRASAELGAHGFLREMRASAAAVAVTQLSRRSASLGAVLSSAWLYMRTLAASHADSQALEDARTARAVGCTAFVGNAARSADDPVCLNDSKRLFSGRVDAVIGASVADCILLFVNDAGEARVGLLDPTAAARRIAADSGLGLPRVPRATLEFTQVPVTVLTVLATGDAAHAVRRTALDVSRVLTAAMAIGISQRAFDAVTDRRRSDRRRSQHEDFGVSDMATLLDASTLTVASAVARLDSGEVAHAECAGAALVATRAATRITHEAIGLLMTDESMPALQRGYIDARFLEACAGGEAALADTVASSLLEE